MGELTNESQIPVTAATGTPVKATILRSSYKIPDQEAIVFDILSAANRGIGCKIDDDMVDSFPPGPNVQQPKTRRHQSLALSAKKNASPSH